MILVTGSDFTSTAGITFGATNAPTFTVISDTEIVVTVPAVTAAGSNLITITNGTGPNTTGKKYTYKAPTVTKVSPNYALEDAAKWVTITGTGFTGSVAADVVIGGTAANAILIISDKKLLAQTATSASKGQGNVVVTRSTVASATSNSNYFLYDDAVPLISYLNGSGSGSGTDEIAVGSSLIITGTDMLGVTKVLFGTSAASASSIVINGAGTTVTVTVPTRSNGPVEVTLVSAIGSSVTNLTTTFNYFTTAAPTISNVYPSSLPANVTTGGGTFLITGSGFTGMGTTEVTLVCTTNVIPTAVTAISDKNLIVAAPGNIGSVVEYCDITLDNPNDATKTLTKTNAMNYV